MYALIRQASCMPVASTLDESLIYVMLKKGGIEEYGPVSVRIRRTWT